MSDERKADESNERDLYPPAVDNESAIAGLDALEAPLSPSSDAAGSSQPTSDEQLEYGLFDSPYEDEREMSIAELKDKVRSLTKETKELYNLNMFFRRQLHESMGLGENKTEDSSSSGSHRTDGEHLPVSSTTKFHIEAIASVNVVVSSERIQSFSIDALTPVNTSMTPVNTSIPEGASLPEVSGSISSGAMADVSCESVGSQIPVLKLRPPNSLSSSVSSVQKTESIKRAVIHPSFWPKPSKCICSCFCQKMIHLKDYVGDICDSSHGEIFLTPSTTTPRASRDSSKLPALQFGPNQTVKTGAQSTPKRQLSSSEVTPSCAPKRRRTDTGPLLTRTASTPTILGDSANLASPGRREHRDVSGEFFFPDELPTIGVTRRSSEPDMRAELMRAVKSSATNPIKPLKVEKPVDRELPLFPSYFESLKDLGSGDMDYESYEQPNIGDVNRKSIGVHKKKSSSKSEPVFVQEPDDVIARLGPMPDEPIFSGYAFIITTTFGPQAWYSRTATSDVDTDISDNESSNRVPLHLPRIRAQILAGCGLYFDELTKVPAHFVRENKLIVVSNRPSRTATYLMAIALNVPIYSHQLIRDACLERKLEPFLYQRTYQLPLGRIASGSWVDFSHSRHPNVFRFLSLGLCSKQENPRTRFWYELMTYLGAKVTLISNDDGRVDIKCVKALVIDDFVTPLLRESAKAYCIPMYSTRWIMDMIIANKASVLKSVEFLEIYGCIVTDTSDDPDVDDI